MDRVSNLPDQIAHYIVSFLNITDLARFGCVSKRCRELYLSAPSLNIDVFSDENESTCSKRQRLFNCLDRFFFRRGDNKIQSLRLVWTIHIIDGTEEPPCFCDDEYFRIMSWIHNAVRCNVEELDVDISTDARVYTPMFPSSVFLCGSLTSLSLDLGEVLTSVPSVPFSSNLKHLELKNGDVKEGFFEWISCCCRCIQVLILECVYVKNMTIESSSLRVFSFSGDDENDILNISCEKLVEINIDWICTFPANKSLHIFAPSLKYFSWTGQLLNPRKIGSLELLEEAAIHLVNKVGDFDNAYDLFSRLCRVKVLTLNEATIKALYREGPITAPLDYVWDLRMHIRSFIDDFIPAMVSLFRRTRSLRTLYIRSKTPLLCESNASGYNMKYWNMQNLAFIHQLKEVTVELSLGSNGVELVRYMLEHAQNLEKMVIVYLPQNFEDIKTRLEECRMISNAAVCLREK